MKKPNSFWVLAGTLGVIVVLGMAVITARRVELPASSNQSAVAAYGKLPLSFEFNQGQSDRQVKFLAKTGGYTLFLTATEAVLSMHRTSAANAPIHHVVGMKLLGTNSAALVQGEQEQPGSSHYLIGQAPERWQRHVRHYARVRYENLYPGVDLLYYGNPQQVEHDFVVAPGADPNQIRFQITNADSVELDAKGELVIHVADDELRLQKPTIYQGEGHDRREIAGNYSLANGSLVGFEVGSFDPAKPLVIDPVLVYSTYLGGSASESFGSAVFVDDTGHIYVTGPTTSADFPTVNALQPNKAGQSAVNAFVAKLSPDGKKLIYSTYLGGSSGDGRAISVDRLGNVYVTGRANSADFPTTSNAWQRTFGGGPSDGWMAKLSPDGASLLYCTYIGGSGTDNGNDLAIDGRDNVIITGATNSENFPTAAAPQSRSGGNFDVFAAKFNPHGQIVYSTYFGGTGEDRGNLISVDPHGNAYVSGRTASVDFPVANALQKIYGGGAYDAHVTKLAPDGKVVFATYLGGSGADTGGKTALDVAGHIFVTGTTNSEDFPVVQPLQHNLSGGSCGTPPRPCYDAFVARLSGDGSTLLYSSYLGGTGEENGLDGMGAIRVDALGFVYVAGRTASTDFPISNALQSRYGGGPFDNFLAKFSPDNSVLMYSTYLGGSGDEAIYDIRTPSPGNVYLSGFTGSTDFPISNPLQPNYNGGSVDSFLAKVSDVLASDVFYFAQAGGGKDFSTAIALTNPSPTQLATGRVSLFAADGSPLNPAMAEPEVPFTIHPLHTVVIHSAEQGSFSSGYARVSSSEPVFANAIYSAAGLPPLSVAPSSLGSQFVATLSRSGGGIEHTIALANVSTSTAVVSLTLVDKQGNTLLSSVVSLAPGEQLSRLLSELNPRISNEFEATLQIAASPAPFAFHAPKLAAMIVETSARRLNGIPLTVIR